MLRKEGRLAQNRFTKRHSRLDAYPKGQHPTRRCWVEVAQISSTFDNKAILVLLGLIEHRSILHKSFPPSMFLRLDVAFPFPMLNLDFAYLAKGEFGRGCGLKWVNDGRGGHPDCLLTMLPSIEVLHPGSRVHVDSAQRALEQLVDTCHSGQMFLRLNMKSKVIGVPSNIAAGLASQDRMVIRTVRQGTCTLCDDSRAVDHAGHRR